MADTRTLKLSLLADVNKFLDGMDKADKGTKSFSSSIGKYSKAMAASFAVAGAAATAYALKLGVDGVKAAIEDEASQKKLATALRNTTKATDKQIAATEDYISATQIRYGISDVKLRSSLGNLLRATNDVTEAQKLNNLAIDIAAATGRDLDSVSLTLAKSYNGNYTALKKLGIPLDENILKTKDFDLITQELTKTFGGSAKANTETFSGQLAILKERFGEIQEDIGYKLIPKLKTLLDQVNMVAKGFSGEDPDGLSNRARELAGEVGGDGAYSLGRSIANLADSFKTFYTAITGEGPTANGILQDTATVLNTIASAITFIGEAYKKGKTIGGGLLDLLDLGMGVGERFGPKGTDTTPLFNKSSAANVRPLASGGTTIIMNGVIDGESARRSIEKVLQNSTRRIGPLDLAGSQL